MIGTSLSHYRIVEKLGAGGMGEVYRAEDTTLSRHVAIKVLPDEFAHDPERLARFEREAKVLASLNHPNIAAIHGLEEADGKRFLVLELVEGQTLAHRLLNGPLPMEEALEVCRQIAEGLESAHEKGVIHRDLKPGNVMITHDDKVKILDFGLARMLHDPTSDIDQTHSPTITEVMTRPGVVLGTAAYMSPEQAKGKQVDKRSDIWAFGCILFECVTGKRAFEGETVAETLAAILKAQPNWTALPLSTRWTFNDLLRRCLQKDPRDRLHDIADARLVLASAELEETGTRVPSSVAALPSRAVPWTVAVVMTLIAAAAIWQNLRRPPEPRPPTRRFVVSLPEPLSSDSKFPVLAISPDGMQLAYVAGRTPATRIYHRRLDERGFKPIAGSEGASDPFFSPDGRWIGFFAGGRLGKAQVSGGPAVFLTDNLGPMCSGGTWTTENVILFQRDWSRGIARVLDSGLEGKLDLVLKPESKYDEMGLLWPQSLPSGDLVLLTTFAGNIASMNAARIAVARIGDDSVRKVLAGGMYGRYLPTGHLVYGYDGKLMATLLDLATLQTAGNTVLAQEGVQMSANTGIAGFAVSNTGDLLYIPGEVLRDRDIFVLMDRNGTGTPLIPSSVANDSLRMTSPSVSPDASRVAVHVSQANDDIYVYSFESGNLQRATFERSNERSPIWAPDGKTFAYTSESPPNLRMYLKSVDDSIEPKALFSSDSPRYPASFSPDGKVLAFVENNPKTGWDIWTAPLGSQGQPKPFLQTEYSEFSPEFSPNGQWIAYQSDESGGQMQIFVARYPDGGSKHQISQSGGTEPRWSPSGEELYYRNGDQFMAVSIGLKSTIELRGTSRLFSIDQSFRGAEVDNPGSYAVMPSGQKFLFIRGAPLKPVTQLDFVLNWFEELKRLAPTGKK